MASLFISYSRNDQAFVRKLYETLVADKHEVFVDWEGIPPSSKWKNEIDAAIDKSDAILCILSPDYLASEVCRHELANAESEKKRLIPIVYREVPASEVPQSLAAINWIFFRSNDDYDASVAVLERAIATDLNYVKESTRLLVRAKEWDGKKQNGSYLLRGSDLAEAERWLAESGGRDPAPSQVQTQYVFTSRRAASRRQWGLISTLSVILVIVIALAGVAVLSYQNAVTQSNTSGVRALAAQCEAPAFGKNLDTRLLLCLLAERDSQRDHVASYDAYNSLLSVIEANSHVAGYLHTPGAKVGDGPISVAESQDGNELASISNTGFFLWNLRHLNSPPMKITGFNPSDTNFTVAISGNGQYAAGMGEYFTNFAADNDRNDLLIVNTSTGKLVHYYPYLTQSTYPEANATDMALSADGTHIVSSFYVPSSSSVSHIIVWPTSGDPSKPTSTVAVAGEIDQVVMSPDNKWVGMSDDLSTPDTYLWNLTTGAVTTVAAFAPISKVAISGDGSTGGMAFTSDGTHFVASGLNDNPDPALVSQTGVWDLSSGHPSVLARFPINGAVATYGPSGIYVVGCEDPIESPCQAETLTDIDFSDFEVGVTDSLTGLGNVTDISAPTSLPADGAGELPLAMGTDTGDIILYLSETLYSDQYWPVLGPNIGSSVSDAPSASDTPWLSPNGKYITAFDSSGSLRIWHVGSNINQSPQDVAPELTRGISNPATTSSTASFSTPKIALANDASAVAFIDDNPQSPNSIFVRHANGRTLTISVSSVVADLSFDWSGKQLAAIVCTDGPDADASCSTGEMRVWDATTGRLLQRYALNNIDSLAFTPDDNTVIVGGINSVALIDLGKHTVISAQFLKEAGIVQQIRVSADGRTLGAAIDPNATTAGSGPYSPNSQSNSVLQLWDIATQQPLGAALNGVGVGVNTSFAFTSSGDILDTSNVPFLNIYPIGISHLEARACQVANRNLTNSEWNLYAPNDQESQLCPQAKN